jgi:FlaA1/EpsC-like NDP-sugar epimerase
VTIIQNSTLDKDLFELVVRRPEINLLSDIDIRDIFSESKILIIGAGGSVGSALARCLSAAKINGVYFLDRDESALHALALELSNKETDRSESCFVGDIRDRQSIKEVILQVKPTVVVHAAALKHLVTLERFPREGFLTNIVGTLNMAELCVEYGVEQFVNISTDKAAYPTSILGKTKKLAELISEEVFLGTELRQCSVRFGNVFASRGSVIETFIHQIKNNLPVTLSDNKVARFFMSHNEAANLVLAAVSLKQNGTFIQKMGSEIQIKDVINVIAKYLGVKPSIQIVGLKKGEKMHEELYDGPVTKTKFDAILRSNHEIKKGLVDEVHELKLLNNEEATMQIDYLVSKYL